MKKAFHNMLEQKVGRSPVSHPFLRAFLEKEGFNREEIKTIVGRYFTPSINHYTLKKFMSDE